MSADEYEAALHGIELPVRIQLFPGTIVSDVPAFIKSSLLLLRTAKNQKQTDVVCYRLDRLLECLEIKGQTPT